MIKRIARRIIEFVYPDYLYAKKSYAQDGEDIILSCFYEGKSGHTGFYIDVGAHHPYRFSNTALFYKKGWKGINIEPTPSLIQSFKNIRKRDINLNVGISDKCEELVFYEFDEAALNSFSKELSVYRSENTRYNIISERTIPVYTLETILKRHLPENQKIDFITIDVEGLDLAVLKSNNWEKYRADYVLAEGDVDFEHLHSSGIYKFMKEKEYNLVGLTKRTCIFKDARLSDKIH